MIEELKLKGTELLVYALIYSYSRDNGGEFIGDTKYIAKRVAVSDDSVRTALFSLTDKGFLKSTRYSGELRARYRVVEEVDTTQLVNFEETSSSTSLPSSSEKTFDFRAECLALGADKEVVDTWLRVRKNKKATNSKLSLDALVREAKKANITPAEAIRLAAESSWISFKAEYIKKDAAPRFKSADERYRERIERDKEFARAHISQKTFDKVFAPQLEAERAWWAQHDKEVYERRAREAAKKAQEQAQALPPAPKDEEPDDQTSLDNII